MKNHLCPDTWVQVQVWCECDGVAMISAVVQYAGRQSVSYCARPLCTVYIGYVTISCSPLRHKTTVADNYNIFSNNGKTHFTANVWTQFNELCHKEDSTNTT